jgi:Uncharacterized protein conserved in bacteria
MSLIRIVCIIVGTISLILGVVGIFVPLLPTTPFLLLTAYLYLKGSPKWYDRLISQPKLGPYILNYQKNKVIPKRVKITSLTFLWASILFCIFFVVPSLWLKILLLLIAVGVSIHILRLRTK